MKKIIIAVLISFVGTTLVAGNEAAIEHQSPQKIQKNAPAPKKHPLKKQSPRPSTKKSSPVIDKPVQKRCQHMQRKKKIEPKKEVKKPETVPAPKPPIEKAKQPEQKIETKVLDPEKKSTQRTIEIKNGITQDMITYHHWTGKHTPEFTISLNGKEIKSDQVTEVTVTNDTLTVEYTFNFAKGYYKDSKKVEISVPEGKKFLMRFSWKQTPNIIINKDEATQTQTSTKS